MQLKITLFNEKQNSTFHSQTVSPAAGGCQCRVMSGQQPPHPAVADAAPHLYHCEHHPHPCWQVYSTVCSTPHSTEYDTKPITTAPRSFLAITLEHLLGTCHCLQLFYVHQKSHNFSHNTNTVHFSAL